MDLHRQRQTRDIHSQKAAKQSNVTEGDNQAVNQSFVNGESEIERVEEKDRDRQTYTQTTDKQAGRQMDGKGERGGETERGERQREEQFSH